MTFNTILTVIEGHVNLLLHKPLGPTTIDQIKQISFAAKRATGLTRQLVAAGGRQLVQMEVLGLNGILGNLNPMLNRLVGESIVLKDSYAADLPAILAQPDIAGCGEWGEQYLVEDFIGGPEVALEGLVIAGRLHVLAIFDKPDPLDGPFFEETIYVTPSRLPDAVQVAIAECAQAAVTAFDLREGPIHAELRWNEQGAWLIELAARPIGGRCSAALKFGDGVTLEELIVRHALGMALPSLEREARPSGVMMIPVPRSGTLRAIRGQTDAARVPGIDAVQVTVALGQALVAWPEGSRYVGFIFAHGDTPQVVEAALRAAHQEIELVIESPRD